MMTLLYASLYTGALVFLAGCTWRVVRYARMPLHLRWELYPVPHEDSHRVEHGGSYFEEADWWKKRRHYNLSGELSFMVPEMVFLKGLREFNPKLWNRSFPFHSGLYLVAGSGALLGFASLLSLVWPHVLAGGLGTSLHLLYKFASLAGSSLIILGCFGLLLRRSTDEELRNHTVPGDIFNLLFFFVTFSTLLAGYLFRGSSFPGMLALARGLLSVHLVPAVSGMFQAGLLLLAALVAYIPYTHMSHFIAKYFTYHSVRWDDASIRHKPKIAQQMAEYLTYRPTWSAAHIAGNGRKTWAEIAAENPAQEKKS